MKLAPIILFAFKRPEELAQVVNALQANTLAENSVLYIFIDGPRNEQDLFKVEEVRRFCDTIIGFKEIHRKYHLVNQGCANSIIDGISTVLREYEAAIIIEDDIVTSPNFLAYMNQGLYFYKEVADVFSLSGYVLPFEKPVGYEHDAFIFPRSGSWGWATWSNRWFSVDWEVSDFDSFKKDKKAQKAFKFGGSDLVKMLNDYMKGTIDAWDIRFTYSQFKQQGLTVYPTVSKVQNIGFSSPDATHTHVYNRYKTTLDTSQQVSFSFPENLSLNKAYVKAFQARYSITTRVLGRIKTWIGMR